MVIRVDMSPISPKGHTPATHTSDSWITPKWLLERLGPFDLDPCACDPQPWPTARTMLTRAQDGLSVPWFGLVWCNPPYGRLVGRWLQRAAAHGNCVSLVFARTETAAFHDHVWPTDDALLFLRGRLNFALPDGSSSTKSHNSGGPSVLIAHGPTAVRRLVVCSDLGALVHLK